MKQTANNNDGIDQWTTEQTPVDGIDDALRLIIGAGNTGSNINSGIAALRGYLTDEMPGRHRLWWTTGPNGPLAAGLAVHSPGNTAVTLFSTSESGRVPPHALCELLRKLADEILAGDETLVQALLNTTANGDIEAFEQAGFSNLAELIFMRNSMRAPFKPRGSEPAEPDNLHMLHYEQNTDTMFREAILASYAESLDCPALEGIRNIDDVIAGHKAAGIFRPDLWTVALIDEQPAGVLLINQNAMHNTAEIVYMGVSKPFRGRGLGRILLNEARKMATADRFSALTLAVDAKNHYAHKLYINEGFTETMRKLAYVKLKDKAL